jgi:ABC-type branched-subunit amino acid transport system permease subunit
MYPAYGYATMRESGQLFLPWFDIIPGPIDIPDHISFGDGVGVGKLAAVGGALAVSVLLGVGLHYLVFGPLRDSPPISKIIASLGVLSYLQSVAAHQFGVQARQVEGILPQGTFENVFGLGGNLAHSRVVIAAVAVGVGAMLWAYYRFTMIGLATRAADESMQGAVVLGWSPQRLASINWLISAVITGMAGVLFLDITSLSPAGYTLLIVPALGAALLANLTSPMIAAAGGVAIGMVQSAAVRVAGFDWWPDAIPSQGIRGAVPFLVIVLVQFWRGDQLPTRTTVVTRPQPRAPISHRPITIAAVLAVAIFLVAAPAQGADEARLVTTLIAGLLMLSSVVLVGYLGQVSLANLAFAGIAAYIAIRMASDGTPGEYSIFVVNGPGLPDPLAALVGVAAAVVAGVLVAIPALRIRGIHLALVTLAAATAATELVFANPAFVGSTAGANTPVPRPSWFGIDVGSRDQLTGRSDNSAFTVLVAIMLIGSVIAVLNVRRGAVGRQMLATRANERAAAAVGIDVTRVKLVGFGISAAIAGMAGVLIAYSLTVLSIQTWSPFGGITSLTLLFIGGVGSIAGMIIGAVLIPAGVLSSSASQGEFLRGAVSGMVMIAVAVKRPDGLSSLGRPILDGAKRRWRTTNPYQSHSDGPVISSGEL